MSNDEATQEKLAEIVEMLTRLERKVDALNHDVQAARNAAQQAANKH